MRTIVVFRVYSDGEVLALFPGIEGDVSWHCMCYVHNGQHGAADYAHCIRQTKPATRAQSARLRAELEAPPFGYVFDERKRYIRRRAK